ncbi:MAG: hypothetical protein M3456_16435 [Actinomycetota bacterium]|nr:hypothetical protein [Actinomycetota bacterium]
MKAKKGDEDASRAADPALEQGRAAGEDAEKEPGAEPEEDEDKVEEASGDSFPTSDAPSW